MASGELTKSEILGNWEFATNRLSSFSKRARSKSQANWEHRAILLKKEGKRDAEERSAKSYNVSTG